MSRDLVVRRIGGRVTLRFNTHTLRVALLLSLLMVTCVLGALCLGSRATPPLAVFRALVAPAHSDINFIVNSLRLPRILLALLVGAALAVAGLILQGIVRNPLASPDILGITGGAAAAAVIFLVLAGHQASVTWLPLAALTGAACASLLVFVLAWRRGVTPARLVLTGIGVAAAATAVTTLLIVFSADATAMRAYVWLTGSLYASQWRDVLGMLPWIVILLPATLLMARRMDVMSLGDGMAYGLGLNVTRSRLLLLIISVGLAGSAVAFAGGLSFVGLIAPHIARRLIGRGFAGLVVVSALTGGLIVLVADLIGRVVFLPQDLPAGIFVAGIGAPFFVYLLYRSRF